MISGIYSSRALNRANAAPVSHRIQAEHLLDQVLRLVRNGAPVLRVERNLACVYGTNRQTEEEDVACVLISVAIQNERQGRRQGGGGGGHHQRQID